MSSAHRIVALVSHSVLDTSTTAVQPKLEELDGQMAAKMSGGVVWQDITNVTEIGRATGFGTGAGVSTRVGTGVRTGTGVGEGGRDGTCAEELEEAESVYPFEAWLSKERLPNSISICRV